jgi:acetylornithine deacetylase/succinyl-diaminopimelate desuccinylase-like protein
VTPAHAAPRPLSLERDYVWTLFERLVESDTSVRPGETTVPPSDKRVETFARDVAAVELRKLGAKVEVDALNNVVGRFGELTGTELAFVSYPVTHHANLMVDPLHPRVTMVANQAVWSGLGASQGKAGLAAVCGAAQAVLKSGEELSGRIVLAISSEGSSTHRSAETLYRLLNPRPAAVVMTIGTENRLVLGNRGRVDIRIDIPGQATHSSSPHLGSNPIPQVQAVLARLSELRIDRAPHPQLGARNLVPYSLVCGPIAPHTIPETCRITLDRRLLPGDSAQAAVEEVTRALADLPVKVSMGPLMLPALTAADNPSIAILRQAAESALGRSLSPTYPPWTFDAGYPVSLGIPTLMFGPSVAGAAGADVLNDDHVPEAMVMEAAAAYAAFMSCRLAS